MSYVGMTFVFKPPSPIARCLGHINFTKPHKTQNLNYFFLYSLNSLFCDLKIENLMSIKLGI